VQQKSPDTTKISNPPTPRSPSTVVVPSCSAGPKLPSHPRARLSTRRLGPPPPARFLGESLSPGRVQRSFDPRGAPDSHCRVAISSSFFPQPSTHSLSPPSSCPTKFISPLPPSIRSIARDPQARWEPPPPSKCCPDHGEFPLPPPPPSTIPRNLGGRRPVFLHTNRVKPIGIFCFRSSANFRAFYAPPRVPPGPGVYCLSRFAF
jgi:hypothetical protein